MCIPLFDTVEVPDDEKRIYELYGYEECVTNIHE